MKIDLRKFDSKLSSKYKKGDIIFRQGDRCKYLSIIKKGEVEISRLSYKGNKILYALLTTGDMFGNNLLFSNEQNYKGDVIAVSDGELILFDKNSVINLMQNDSDFLQTYLNYEAEFTKQINSRMNVLLLNDLEEKILSFIKARGGSISIKSVSSFAKYLNVSREALSRKLSNLEKQNKIKRNINKVSIS